MADTSKSIVDNLLTLNFLAGKRTYLIGLLVFAQAVIGFFKIGRASCRGRV